MPLFETSDIDKRTIALELAYNYRKGQLQKENEGDYSPYNDIDNKARNWAEQNHTEFLEEAERLLTKLNSPL